MTDMTYEDFSEASDKPKLYLFGVPRIMHANHEIHLNRRKMYGLLSYMAFTKRQFHRDKLADLFWPDHDASHSHSSLRVVLSEIHKAIDPDILPVTNELIGPLDLKRISVDIEEFQVVMAQIHQNQRPGAGKPLSEKAESSRKLLLEAINMYRDDFMSGFTLEKCRQYSDWQFQQGEYLHRELCYALERLVKFCEYDEEYEKGITHCRRFVEEDYLNEDAHCTLMRLYAANGQKEASLHQFLLCKKALQEQLGIGPEESTVELYESIHHNRPVLMEDLEKEFPPHRTLEVAVNNLPLQLTNFIGRKDEIEDIIKLLDNSRLLTLLGQGGVGKTRLSIHITSEYLETIKDGIWFIDLSSVTNSENIFIKIAEALNIGTETFISIEQNVTNYLKKKTVLLLLDNCEHLIKACADAVIEILTSCPDVQILATSREPLKIFGETTYRISSLSIPPLEIEKPEILNQYESSQLFIDRSIKVNPSFSVSNQSAPALSQICIWLDGMPLALELAAARTRVFSLTEIAERLTNRFSLLKSNDQNLMPRHKTLKSLIDWSYDLLTINEKLMFTKFSIFIGGWDYDAAKTVCSENITIPLGGTSLFFDFINGDLPGEKRYYTVVPDDEEAEILDVLTALVEKSLVIVEESNGKSRYRMLESIHEYAREKLYETGLETSLQERYLDYYILKTEKIELRVFQNFEDDAIFILSPDYINIQKALTIGLENQNFIEKGMRLAGALYSFWKIKGYFLKGLDWCRRYLSVSEEIVDLKIQWKILFEAAMFAANSQKYGEAEKYNDENFEICKKLKSECAYALVLRAKGFSLFFTTPDKSEPVEKECLSILEKNDLKYWIPVVMLNLGLANKNHHKGAALQEQSLAIARSLKHRAAIVGNLLNLGDFDLYLGNYASGVKLLEEGLSINKNAGERLFRLYLLNSLGIAYRCQGDILRAKDCHSEVLNIAEELDFVQEQERSLGHLGLIKFLQGCPKEAKNLLLYAFKLHIPRKPMNRDLVFLFVSAKIFYSMEHYTLAVIFLSSLKPHIVEREADFSKMDREDYNSLVIEAKTRISSEEYNGAWEEGSKLIFDQLIELALESDFFRNL